MSTGPRRFRFPLWIVLGGVLVVALVIGSGVLNSAPVTPAQRAVAIETRIKCPSCEDLSVANSSAQTAVIVRGTVGQLIGEGKSDQQIEAYLVSRYGSAIVLVPPASGWSLLVWVLPLGGGAVALAVLTVVLVRKRRNGVVDPTEAARLETELDAGASSDQLDTRRQFLEQSLADAFAEHRAGDLSDHDYQTLRRRDTARLAALDIRMVEADDLAAAGADGSVATAVAADVDEGDQGAGVRPVDTPGSTPTAVPVPAPRRSRRQRLLISGAVASFAAALVLVVALFAANRLPGQTPTGNPTLSQQAQVQQSLDQAATLENEGQPGAAAQLYQKVLGQDPQNEVAVAQLGWLEYQTGAQGNSPSLIADARAKLEQAVKLNPTDYAARLYLGTVFLDQDHDASGAVAQYQAFLAANPPASLLQQAASLLRQAYTQAGMPVPSSVPAA
ncbi:MAG TPA: cytochrome c-type biogenesis protein CcmH [Acidimicrobiales bacterium]|nr:cytochrome c-type biogenesis protein CcmH [Acidimicrobiales bacterium]